MNLTKWLGLACVLAACGNAPESAAISNVDRTAIPVATQSLALCAPGAAEVCSGTDGCQGTRRCADDGSEMGLCRCSADCAEGAKSIYVISTGRGLFRFDPATVGFTLVGQLSCPISPVSMAIDRQGVAWVLSDEGSLFRVSTEDGSCSPTDFVPGQESFFKFGMGFATDTPSSTAETLYIGGDKTFGKIDLASLRVSMVARWNLMASELTGTVDARVFAFTHTAGASISEVEPQTGSVVSTLPLTGVAIDDTYAIAAYGRDLWLFTDANVHKYDPATRQVSLARTNIGFSVVGAGASTCAAMP